MQYDAKNNSSIWREFMRIRIKVDVRRPLKRKKKIVKKDKIKVVFTCKYEKLGDFCFICGLLSHTERFCQNKLETEEGSITREWGHWLRAPPRKMAGNSRSKWLRAEGEGDWGRQEVRDTHRAENQGFQTRAATDGRSQRDKTHKKADILGYTNNYGTEMQLKEGNLNLNDSTGLDSDELYGLALEERKRQRVEAQLNKTQVHVSNVPNKDSILSHRDCIETSSNLEATLARQASRKPRVT